MNGVHLRTLLDDQGRDTRGLPWIDAISLDAKLGARILIKHRWLTLVGGFALAVAIAIGASFDEVLSEFSNPDLPLPDGSASSPSTFRPIFPAAPSAACCTTS